MTSLFIVVQSQTNTSENLYLIYLFWNVSFSYFSDTKNRGNKGKWRHEIKT